MRASMNPTKRSPTIRVSAEEKRRMTWRKLLTIKCLGKRLGYNFMVRRISQLWLETEITVYGY